MKLSSWPWGKQLFPKQNILTTIKNTGKLDFTEIKNLRT